MNLMAEPLIEASPYQGYTYGYPHKTAYRALPEPVALKQAWAMERKDSLFLYLHVPFCEMRCGFCNLFTQAKPRDGVASRYLDALERQASQVRDALGDTRFARLAIGGGTPTALDLDGLQRLFQIAEGMLGGPVNVPSSIEVSPETVDDEKLAFLRERGIRRVSIGVQSFLETETSAVGRPQKAERVHAVLKMIRAANLPVLNIDLIYGLPGQTVASWLQSIREALRYQPEELYLYPLYVRPETGLGRSRRAWDDLRLACYREAVAFLNEQGYEQLSMRMFRARHSPAEDGPVYCCQADGMVGLGCGARSYTTTLHYADRYAVRNEGVRAILEDYIARPTERFAYASHGFILDDTEQRRRHVLISLLQRVGLDLEGYRARFGTDAMDDFPELSGFFLSGFVRQEGNRLRLTDAGLEHSDAIGPWLYSLVVRSRMEEYQWD